MKLPPFSVTYDYRCPFARNAHEHLVEALKGGAGWEVEFVPFSLSQVHVEEGGTPAWDNPEKEGDLMAMEAGIVVRDRYPDRFPDVHLALFAARHDEGQDLREESVIRAILSSAGVDADAVLEAISEGWPRKAFRKAHEESVDQQKVFGVPTFIVDDEAVFVRIMTAPRRRHRECPRHHRARGLPPHRPPRAQRVQAHLDLPVGSAAMSVAVVMGSASDVSVMEGAVEALREFSVPVEVRVLSAHRTPDDAIDFARGAADRGIKVVIAGAGGAAHLAGVLAAATPLPVIGVPIVFGQLGGLDSLLAMVQMPKGIPVATVAVNGARNAGLLAVRILALSDEGLAAALVQHREVMAAQVRASDAEVRARYAEPG